MNSQQIATFTLTDALELLTRQSRRGILMDLRDSDPGDSLSMAEANEEVEFEADLIHNHLPRLEEAGVIEWDRKGSKIYRGPEFERIEPLLRLIDEHEDELPPDWP